MVRYLMWSIIAVLLILNISAYYHSNHYKLYDVTEFDCSNSDILLVYQFIDRPDNLTYTTSKLIYKSAIVDISPKSKLDLEDLGQLNASIFQGQDIVQEADKYANSILADPDNLGLGRYPYTMIKAKPIPNSDGSGSQFGFALCLYFDTVPDEIINEVKNTPITSRGRQ